MAYLTFDYFDNPQTKQHLGIPTSFYDPADFSGDSAHSPDSPLSPVFANPYQLPVTNESNDWVSWEDKATLSPDLDSLPKQEPFESINLSNIPSRDTMELRAAINPRDLGGTIPDAVPFGRVGLNDIDTQPLFQTPVPSSSSQSDHLQTSMMPPITNPTHMSAGPSSLKDASNRYPSRKRKSLGSGTSSSHSSVSPPPALRRHCSPPKKTAHNMIEKRYRTNLNDKIAAVRDSVPALRVMVHRLEQHESEGIDEGVDEDLGGLAPAHKLNKATILSKATEYIAHLERKNQSLARENSQLRNRVDGFEMLVMTRDSNPRPAGVRA